MESIYCDSSDSVLLATFRVKKKRVRAVLHGGKITWEAYSNRRSTIQHQVSLLDVIAATNNGTVFTLYYALQASGNRWRVAHSTFVAVDAETAEAWGLEVRRQLALHTHRPRNILMFVNPYGGRKNALSIYKRKVSPLLKLVGVEVDLVVSERHRQIQEILEKQNLDTYDGVACIGGDGTFAEVFNGVVTKECSDQGIPMNSNQLPTPRIPLAVIPGGSTNTVAYCLHGTDDVTTCVVHMVLGLRTGLDLCSVIFGDGSAKLYASVISYGYLGDIAHDSERYRWMGPRRYEYTGFHKLLRNRGYKGEITVIPDCSDPQACSTKCYEECTRCSPSTANTKADYNQAQVIKGKFFMVNGANIPCACTRSPNGMSPNCHLGDGCVDVIVVYHTHFFNNLRLLLKLSSKTGAVSELPFVKVFRSRGFQFRAAEGPEQSSTGSTQPIHNPDECGVVKNSVWNCDGEVLPTADTTVLTHRQLVKVFRRPLSAPDEPSGCFLCNC
ncbi:ceramide kinase [Sergentomyia squamirostris]